MHVMEYDIHRASRQCTKTGRVLAEGEEFFSVLAPEGSGYRRLDYCVEAWTGPPPDAVATWKSRVPRRDAKKAKAAPNDVLLQWFVKLGDMPEQRDLRYVLALLLVRRRVLRQEEAREGDEALTLYCPRDEQTYRVDAVLPGPARTAAIQEELTRWLA